MLAIVLFHFNIFNLGLPLIAFFCNLIFTSWAVGIFVSGLVLRNGMGAEGIVWTLMFALMPLACVYYPVRVLPHWLQHVSWALPPTYVFEGMRTLLIDGIFRADLMADGARRSTLSCWWRRLRHSLPFCAAPRRHGSLLGGGE